MTRKRNRIRIGRNEACPCGSGSKFKVCHGRAADSQLRPYLKQYIDTGESAIRWVIANSKATAFFADVGNRIIVFPTREMAVEISRLDVFADQEPNELNIAGIGPTKWTHLQETLPFVEVVSVDQAKALIHERLEAQRAELGLVDAVKPAQQSDEAQEA